MSCPKVALLFPPSWTLTTGSVHLALPLLQGSLQAQGVETLVIDLNIRATSAIGSYVDTTRAAAASDIATLDAMNEPYFGAEDPLNELARVYGGSWNIQTGFSFDDQPQKSTQRLFEATRRPSPFSATLHDAAKEIESFDPDVIGISVASEFQLVHAFSLAQIIKSAAVRAPVVLGGNVITRLLDPLKVAAGTFDFVDGLVPYGGEVALGALAAIRGDYRRFAEVPSMVWRDAGTVRENPHRLVRSSEGAAPSYHGLDGRYWGVSYATLVNERGCYYGKCSFCAIPFGWGPNGYAGRRGLDATLADMRDVSEKTGVRRFKFVDEAIRPSLVSGLSAALPPQTFEWEAYARLEPSFEDVGLLQAGANSGLRKLYFGLEVIPSGNRGKLGKNDYGNVAAILAACADAGVKVHFFCMVGFPGTSAGDGQRTVDFVLANHDRIDTVDVVGWGYARHTRVPGVKITAPESDDLALEYDWAPEGSEILGPEEVEALADECLDSVWNVAPKMLHPTYRLVTPWASS